jgi:subtilisin-like proprotein convertase family protein
MRTGSSEFLRRRGRMSHMAQLRRNRKSRDYRIDLEGLEARTLLATTPAVTATGVPVALSPFGTQQPFDGQDTNFPYGNVTTSGNANSPTVAIDPYDPSKLFAVWGLDLSTLTPPPTIVTAVVEAAYSSNGGTTWTGLGEINLPLTDAATIDSNPPTPYAQVTEPNVAFDASGNAYVLTLQSTGPADGALVLSKWNFTGSAPVQIDYPDNNSGIFTNGYSVVYRWLSTSDAANTPTLDVDSGLLNPPAGVPADPFANNVYVAWASTDIKPAALPATADYNPNRAELVVSSDGGNTFSGETILNVGGNFGGAANGLQDFSHPALAINQNDDGLITAAWEDFGSGATATPNYNTFSLLESSLVPAGDSFGFTNNGGTIGSDTTTPFPVAVNISNPAPATGLTVTVNLIHPTDANVGLVLQAPDGATITLMQAGTITGANIGVFGESTTSFGVNIGTVFDDNATRGIFDPNTGGTNAITGPAVGHYQITGAPTDTLPFDEDTLTNFVTYVQSHGGLNGTWTLNVEDIKTETALGNVRNFTLQITTGMVAAAPQNVATFFGFGGQVVGGALLNTGYPTVAPSTAQGIGPGLVLAVDNTLGPDSPFQGRVYAAFVGYYNVKVSGVQNPDSNTDVFLTFLPPPHRRRPEPDVERTSPGKRRRRSGGRLQPVERKPQ